MATAPPPTVDWETLCTSKRSSVFAKIPKSWLLPSSLRSTFHEKSTLNVLDIPRKSGILTPEELNLTENYDATQLVQLMSTGQLSSLAVVTAFCKRAAIAQQCVSCLTEIMFDEALAAARGCDEYLAKYKKPMGPFHGLPVSLKDTFNVKGVQSTIGFASFITRPASETDAVLVGILRAAGAVFYVKTNLPQTMMATDSHNNIFGRTLNPRKLSLTAGGSTGGEAALIAMRGSVLGVCTDIAGSARIPALCCGISSLMTTASRLPYEGVVLPGRLGSPGAIVPVIGSCCRSVRDYELFMKTVIDAQPWTLDENVINSPWRSVQPETRRLRFGLLRECTQRPLHPPIARALHTAATMLKAHGHEIVLLDDKVPDIYASAILAFKYFMLDPQNTTIKNVLSSGEPLIPSLSKPAFSELNGWEPTLNKLWDMNVELGKTHRAWRKVMVEEKLDAVLGCGYQTTSVPHDTYGVPVYTVLQNLLNYPAGTLPFGVANRELDASFARSDVTYEPPYQPDAVEGAPAHVQIIGKPMMDEELLQIIKVVGKILNGSSDENSANAIWVGDTRRRTSFL
ncbi:amidase [Plenodomus tracheiphilus IPT5]|uniref:Amidase n=1 Tax=Plenodomus tracheiphilus IPT5 TaxID=1408161 RepID=A0A6A7BLF7_9PLEO|nr:amidase [Plenodomus tracheiphilus IPT5]